MNTMADGAAQRLVAQIGEALFGQPGLTLMELAEKVKASQPTPSSRWAANGEPDPHGSRYDCERAALVMGDLSDDELANAVFLHGNEQPTMAQMVSGAMLPIAYLTAAKDRIRWLSRALAAAQAKNAAPPSPAGQGHALPPVREDQPLRGDEPIGEQHDARIFNRGWNACREAAAALAARQPTGTVSAHRFIQNHQGLKHTIWMDGDASESEVDAERAGIGRIERAYAAPPVRAAEAVGEIDEGEDGRFVELYPDRELPLGAKVYLVPPAQAVDLGKLRALARNWLIGYGGTVGEARRACADDLLALIDSKAVGNGR